MLNIIDRIQFKIYQIIFKEKAPEAVKTFLKNFWYVATGFGVSYILVFIFQIVIGRVLGPAEYGKYALIQSIALFLYLPMNLGISTALIKYNAENSELERQKKIISISYLLTFFLSLVSIVLFFVFPSATSKIFGVPSEIFSLAVIFAFFYNIYTLATSTVRSLHKMKEFSFFQALYGISMMVLLMFLFFSKMISFQAAILTVCASYGIVSLLIFINLRHFISFSFDNDWFKKIIKYGTYATLGGIAYAFLSNYNKIMINKYLTVADVGIYNAYYISSIGILAIILGIFTTVFFPTMSKYQQKKPIFKKINKFMPLFLLAIILPFMLAEFVILKLYGDKYPIDYLLMFEFVVTGVFIVGYGIYDWLFASEGIKGMRLSAISIGSMALVNIFTAPYLVSRFDLHGAILSLGAVYFLGIINFSFLQRKII